MPGAAVSAGRPGLGEDPGGLPAALPGRVLHPHGRAGAAEGAQGGEALAHADRVQGEDMYIYMGFGLH